MTKLSFYQPRWPSAGSVLSGFEFKPAAKWMDSFSKRAGDGRTMISDARHRGLTVWKQSFYRASWVSAENQVRKSRKTFPFMDLPRELRNMVYEYCLVTGNVYPYLEAHRWEVQTDIVHQDSYYYDTPNIPLLKTCKSIHWEAERFLYQKNNFVMPTSTLTEKFFTNSINTSLRRSWLKSIELDLDASDLGTEDLKVIHGSRLGWYKQFERALKLDRRAPSPSYFLRTCGREVHRANKAYLVDICWPRKLAHILEHLRLEKLVVNIENSRCEDGCCPMYAGAVAALHEGFALAMPKTITIYGTEQFIDENYFDLRDDVGEIIQNRIKRWSLDRRCRDLVAEVAAGRLEDNGRGTWLRNIEWEVDLQGKWL